MDGVTQLHDDAFAIDRSARASLRLLGGRIPILIVDHVFREPEALRARALGMKFQRAQTAYPGRVAQLDAGEPSLEQFLRSVLALVNGQYLPRVPTIVEDGKAISAFQRVHPDFAITDLHPEQLAPTQAKPHVDPVPIFGLVYLNEEARGGTLFFEPPSGGSVPQSRQGYCSATDAEFRAIGRIDGVFNRLAIYPGFVPHSGEIEGEWISTDDRFTSPRLTLRLAFLP